MSEHAEVTREHDRLARIVHSVYQSVYAQEHNTNGKGVIESDDIAHDAVAQTLADCERHKALGAAVRELLELYPQSYRCEHGSREMTHIEVADWKEIRAKLEAELERSAKP